MVYKMKITLFKEVPIKNRLCFTLDVTADDEQQAKFFAEYAVEQFISDGVTIEAEVVEIVERQSALNVG